jgi:5-hydroxyisourate hydrolase-like protein (transthyretin family)
MFQRSHLGVCFLVAGIGLSVCSLALFAQDDNSYRGRKYKVPPPSARVVVTVLRDSSGKPIEDAHVIFHPIEGDKDKGSLELKTNEDGKIVIDVIPIGDTVRLQIIANGFQTYGHDFKIDKPEMSMEIRMKRPGAQYSVYKNTGTNSGSGNGSGPGSGSEKPANPPNSAPPAAGSKPSGPDSQPGAQPQPQPK